MDSRGLRRLGTGAIGALTKGLLKGCGLTIITVMARKRPFALVYADEIKHHLQAVEKKYHALIRAEIEQQLLFEPEVETRNRKPLKRPIAFGGEWELRLGPDIRFRASTRCRPRATRSVSWPSA
jgi:hypothetical protein